MLAKPLAYPSTYTHMTYSTIHSSELVGALIARHPANIMKMMIGWAFIGVYVSFMSVRTLSPALQLYCYPESQLDSI